MPRQLPIGHSPEVFEAYARIDLCYFLMEEMTSASQRPLTPVEKAVDQATGYDPAEETFKGMCDLLEEIIEAKNLIKADPSADQMMLAELRQHLILRNKE